MAQDAITAAMEGFHSSIFVYGQTSTGKTYTMQVRTLYPRTLGHHSDARR